MSDNITIVRAVYSGLSVSVNLRDIDEEAIILEVAIMLNQEMLNKLRHMKMTELAEALEHQEQDPSYNELTFEFSKRQHSRLQRLINQAKFQEPQACVEDFNYTAERKLDRSFILELASCNYIPHAQNIIIVGATGAG